MAILVSPGVSVTVTDESFFIPAAAPTVPLIFIATEDEKYQPDGVTPAEGTYEHDVIRSITSVGQSVNLYGVPRFISDSSGNPQHGDARNEYGLFALNQYLGVGNRSFVIRANVNLNDDPSSIIDMWDRSVADAALILEQLTASRIQLYNEANHLVPGGSNPSTGPGPIITLGPVTNPGNGYVIGTYTNVPLSYSGTTGGGIGATANITVALGGVGPAGTGTVTAVTLVNPGLGYMDTDVLTVLNHPMCGTTGAGFTIAVDATSSTYKTTVTGSELQSDITEAMQIVYDKYSFSKTQSLFEDDHHATTCVSSGGYNGPGYCIYGGTGGYASPATAGFVGIAGIIADDGGIEYTPSDASFLLTSAADEFKYTVQFVDATSLGANDAARRVAIVEALQASINSNQDIRSEQYEYNLILAPGYHEVADELIALSVDIMDEALVIADTPMDMNPDDVVTQWGDSLTSDRRHSYNVAYYYPHGLASNLDGQNVMIASSGIALRTYAYSDNISQVWFAPAGTNRGQVSGVDQIGYVTGTLGTATTFVQSALTLGQRDALYKYYTNINPIANLPGRGIIVFGQKTSANAASAMDRVNVSRLVKYIKRQLRKNTVPFLFEPNDQITRNNIKATIDGFLQDIMVKRGLYDFATLCDESNNTPDRIDRNELYVDIALKPTKAVEFIYIPIRIVSTGAQI